MNILLPDALNQLQIFWNDNHKEFLNQMIEKQRNEQLSSLFTDDIDEKDKYEINKPSIVISQTDNDHLLQILSSTKMLNFSSNKKTIDEDNRYSMAMEIWCRLKVSCNQCIELQFQCESNSDEKVQEIRYIQYTNKIYNALYTFIDNYDLIDVITDYLEWNHNDLIINSYNKLDQEIEKNSISKQKMMSFDWIIFYRGTILKKNDYLRIDNTKYDNNQQFICSQYDINANILSLLIKCILYMNDDTNMVWSEFEERVMDKEKCVKPIINEFMKGQTIDIRITDEHQETFWTTGLICSIQDDKVLIHIPRHGAKWKSKLSDDIAPAGTYTDGLN